MKNTLFVILFFLSTCFYAQVFSIGVAKYKSEDYKGAIDEFTQIIDANPNNARAYFNRALAKNKLYDYKGSMEDYEKVCELDPGNARAFKHAELERRYLARAGGTPLDYTGSSNPYEASIYGEIGWTKEKEGHHLEAIQDFTHAIKLNKTNATYYLGRGNALYHLKEYKSAKEDYTKVVELEPKNAKAYFNKANSEFYLGDKSEACADWLKASKLGLKDADELLAKYGK